MAFFQRLARVLAGRGLPGAAVPHHHGAAAIFALGDGALEGGVGEGMVLGAHGEALVVRVEARPVRHRPALEHPVQLQPQVPVKPGRVVLLDHEAVAMAPAQFLVRALRLVRLREISLRIIGGERIGFATNHR